MLFTDRKQNKTVGRMMNCLIFRVMQFIQASFQIKSNACKENKLQINRKKRYCQKYVLPCKGYLSFKNVGFLLTTVICLAAFAIIIVPGIF